MGVHIQWGSIFNLTPALLLLSMVLSLKLGIILNSRKTHSVNGTSTGKFPNWTTLSITAVLVSGGVVPTNYGNGNNRYCGL